MAEPQNLILIFARNPIAGRCKTRLAARTGDEAALEIYRYLLRHTVSVTRDLKAAKRVYYSEFIEQDDVWDNGLYDKHVQQGADLGVRMSRAFEEGFADGFSNIIIIGTDMLDIGRDDLEQAFQALETHDYVLGPAEDGGYYLLGMNTFNADLFRNKPWGTPEVLKKTLQDLEADTVALLAVKNDIDVYEDIEDREEFKPFLKNP